MVSVTVAIALYCTLGFATAVLVGKTIRFGLGPYDETQEILDQVVALRAQQLARYKRGVNNDQGSALTRITVRPTE